MAFVDPMRAIAAGQQFVDTTAGNIYNRQAARGLAAGNYGQALQSLGNAGDMSGVVAVQNRQQQQQDLQRTRQDADLAKQVAFSRRATQVLRKSLTEGGDPVAAYDSLAPAFQQIGATPEQIQQYRQALAADPVNFLTNIERVTADAERKLEVVNFGSGRGASVVDLGTGEEVRRLTPDRQPLEVNGVLIDPVTYEPIIDTRDPRYQVVTNSDGSTSVVAIDQPTPTPTGAGSSQPRGIRNNNPGNIEDGPFARSLPGYAGSDGRFARFNTMQDGVAAGGRLLDSYAARGLVTPAQIINRWAPPSDNNPTQAYAQYVAQRLGIGVNDPVPANRRAEAFQAINEFENGSRSPSNAPARTGGARVVAQGANLGPSAADQRATQREQAANRKSETDLRKEFNARQEVKDFRTIEAAFRNVQSAANNTSAAGDLSLIFAYMKILDPGSVVREQEFANAQNAAGVPDQIRNAYNKALNGERLNPRQRQDFLNQAGSLYQSRRQAYDGIANEYRSYAQDYGVNPDRVVRAEAQQPRVRFQLSPQQRSWVDQNGQVETPGGPQRQAGSRENPRLINPANPTQSYNNVPRGSYFLTPDGELRQKR